MSIAAVDLHLLDDLRNGCLDERWPIQQIAGPCDQVGTELKAETAKSLSRNDALKIRLCRRVVKVLVREAKQI